MDRDFAEYVLTSLITDPELISILIEYGVEVCDDGLLELLYRLEFYMDCGEFDAF